MFRTPSSQAEWDRLKLPQEHIDFFHEMGYVSNIPLLDEAQIEILRKELDELLDPYHPGNSLFYEFHTNQSKDASKVIFHALGAWRIAEGYHDMLWNPRFTMACHQLMGHKGVRFWHDQLFYKPAKHGGVVAWHQDYSYWTRTTPMQHLTCWTGLDDATTENGYLYYIPKSHTWGFIEKPELTGDMDGIMEFLTDEQKSMFKPIPIELKAGYGTFHHSLMMHGFYANNSERPRRAVVIYVFADGTLSNSDEEVLKGVPIIRKGEKMEGTFFPTLYCTNQSLLTMGLIAPFLLINSQRSY